MAAVPSVFDVGDSVSASLTLPVVPDGTTSAAIVVTQPDGTTLAPAPTSSHSGPVYTSSLFVVSQAGDYVVAWTITGTGAGVYPQVINVRPLPSASNTRPSWAPFLSDVADYVPHKSRDTTPGTDLILGTFTPATLPTDQQAHRVLDEAITTVLGAVPTITPNLAKLAKQAAALRAAADVELAWPERTVDMTTYQALNQRAKDALALLLTAAQQDATGVGPDFPAWSFPDPPQWADIQQMKL